MKVYMKCFNFVKQIYVLLDILVNGHISVRHCQAFHDYQNALCTYNVIAKNLAR